MNFILRCFVECLFLYDLCLVIRFCSVWSRIFASALVPSPASSLLLSLSLLQWATERSRVTARPRKNKQVINGSPKLSLTDICIKCIFPGQYIGCHRVLMSSTVEEQALH